jgi:ubiquinone/menaquinone biosynthesis C-methylase UbiE
MIQDNAFEKYAAEYDEWFNIHTWAYHSEIKAIKLLIPTEGRGIEIGVGTGRFATPFGIKYGVEPSKAMSDIARSRGIKVYEGKAERLPLNDDSFNYALLITTLCFLDSPLQALKETRRIICPNGKIIIGMLDKDSPLGKEYESKKMSSKFSQNATFYSVSQVLEWLEQLGCQQIKICQTMTQSPEDIKTIAPVKEGHGEGLFVAISASTSA